MVLHQEEPLINPVNRNIDTESWSEKTESFRYVEFMPLIAITEYRRQQTPCGIQMAPEPWTGDWGDVPLACFAGEEIMDISQKQVFGGQMNIPPQRGLACIGAFPLIESMVHPLLCQAGLPLKTSGQS